MSNQNNVLIHHGTPRMSESGSFYMIMMDAGYTSSNVFLYEVDDRILDNWEDLQDAIRGQKLSYPSKDGLTLTAKVTPGIGSIATIEDDEEFATALSDYMSPLLEYAMETLNSTEADWESYPIFFGGTGGARALPRPYRVRLVDQMVEILADSPFLFEPQHAKVLSGEEQAAFSWAALNYLEGTFQLGSLASGLFPRETYTMLRLGEDTADVVICEPHDDIMTNHYRFQLGPSQRWDLFTHSFQFSGVLTAFDRVTAALAADPMAELEGGGIYNPCLAGGDSLSVTSMIEVDADGNYVPFSSPEDPLEYQVTEETYLLVNPEETGNYTECARLTYNLLLLETDLNEMWCEFAHDHDCSWAGEFQNTLPYSKDMVATDYIYNVYEFLGLLPKAGRVKLKAAAEEVCGMSWEELVAYNAALENPRPEEEVHRFCFMATWVYNLNVNGYGLDHFPYNLTAVPAPDGAASPTEWTMGAALYHANTLPWNRVFSLSQGEFTTINTEGNLMEAAVLDGDDDSTFFPLGAVFMFLVAMVALVVVVQKNRRDRREAERAATDYDQVLNVGYYQNS